MESVNSLNEEDFKNLCRQITKGLGFSAKPFVIPDSVDRAFFRAEVIRESSDRLYRTNETWLCAFYRSGQSLEPQDVDPIANIVAAAQAAYLLVVVFGSITKTAEDKLRESLNKEGTRAILLADNLCSALIHDYANNDALKAKTPPAGFSFARLRRYTRNMVKDASWSDYFQTISIQPARLLPLHRQTTVLAEADLVRALSEGSLLLLGEPGAGKTTSLQMLAHEMAEVGGYTPLFLPVGRYQGDFWRLLCEALAPGSAPISRETAEALLDSGALILLLDGMNEVQDPDLQRQLVADINDLTAPEKASARSRWIVSGRVYDYEQSRTSLHHLESHRWELQPLSPDLIYRLLADALGEAEGLALYKEMGEHVREICTNPLLLTMTLTVYDKTGHAPAGRSALYSQFIDHLLHWSDDRSLGLAERQTLLNLMPDMRSYSDLVVEALTELATTMPTTMVEWSYAQQCLIRMLASTSDPVQASRLLLQDLVRCTILRRDSFTRVRFYHHTFQEYFLAKALVRSKRPEDLISDNGVPTTQREAILFAAAVLPDPTPLAERAVGIDLTLAYEISRDAGSRIGSPVKKKLAKALWSRVMRTTGLVGNSRRWAILFQRTANLLNQDVEALAAEIDADQDPDSRAGRLVKFYRELGDGAAQRRTLQQAAKGDDVPDHLLFDAALASDDYERTVELYTRFLAKNSSNASAYHNRGIAYNGLGRKEEALADYKQAVKLGGNAARLTSLAVLLYDLGQEQESLVLARQALERDPAHAPAHSRLADWLAKSEPVTALRHCEQAVRYAPHDEVMLMYLGQLADLQEKLGHHAQAMRTLRQLMTLNPTSADVRRWKERIAKARQALDDELRKRSARERLHEQGELPLPTLAIEWLRAAGLSIENPTSTWFLARGGRGLPERLPVVLMGEVYISGALVRAVIDALPRSLKQSSHILLVTAAETLSLEARHQLAALQDQCAVALVTSLEVRDALLSSDRECRLLLDNALSRASRTDNPFSYKGIVREHTEFFGRVAELESLASLLGSGQQVGLYGIHKIGKSSLLEALRRKLHLIRPEITVVKVELEASLKDTSDFYRMVLEHLPGAPELPPTSHISAYSFRRQLTKFHEQRQQQRPNHRLLLLLDEYAYLVPDRNGRGGMNDFLSVLSVLKTLCQEGWLLMVPCGRTASLSRQASWGKDENPFVDLLHAQFLGPLTREENDALMSTLGVRAGLKFTADALESIYNETGGHPAFSRALGEQIAANRASEITASTVADAVGRFLKNRDQLNTLLGIYEQRLDNDEQRLARIVAIDGAQPRNKLLPEDATMDVRRQIRDAVSNLIDTTVLVERDDGRVAHRYGLLRRVIQKEVEDLGL